MKAAIFLFTLIYLGPTVAQDVYQIIRDQADGFAEVKPGRVLEFPLDHAPHPEYRIEWWYITANLQDAQGRDWGIQWTLFRQALSAEVDNEGWDSNQLWMAHAAITKPEGHIFEQRFARGGIGQAGVLGGADKNGFSAWMDDWKWQSNSPELLTSRLDFKIGKHQVKMVLNNTADWVLNGEQGYSQKSEQGQASYYYSQPNISISGKITIEDNEIELNGSAWLDREWSSQALAENQKGWDWFSLHLQDSNKLMLYRLRHADGNHWLSGSWTDPSGRVIALKKSDIKMAVVARRKINISNDSSVQLPFEWQISLPAYNRHWVVKPLYDQQWMDTRFPYWEGVVRVEDAHGELVGRGYMELTGYE